MYFSRLKQSDEGHGVFIECDSTVKDAILRHFKMYKLRRKVNINPCVELSVWAVLPKQTNTGQVSSKPELSTPDKALLLEADPRTNEMGWRLVLDTQVDPLDIMTSCQKGDTEEYHKHRYAIGKTKIHVVLIKRVVFRHLLMCFCFFCWGCRIRTSRGRERPSPRSRTTTGVKSCLHAGDQLQQRLLHWPGTDSQDSSHRGGS